MLHFIESVLNLVKKSSVFFRYHESSQMSSLVETFVSKASALQRQGRAGRVRNGFCFRLYPKYRFGDYCHSGRN